jgi:hypothetical protein
MATAPFNKFNSFVADVGLKVHNLNSDALKIMLTATLPVNTNALKADITEIAAGNGYTAGGTAVAGVAYSQTAGVAKLIGNAVTFTASGGSITTFRYAVLYNSTPAGGNLIAWWDYGASVSLGDGESLKIAKDVAGANWDATTPILSIT